MNLLPEDIQQQIQEYLNFMKDKVTIVLFTKEEPCETCEETTDLLRQIASLSTQLELVEKSFTKDTDDVKKYHIERVPSFVLLDAKGEYHGVKFSGIPGGHEINSFLGALIDMSGMDYGFDDETIKRIQAIKTPTNIKVFVTLSCPHCPGAVQTAHRMAMLNKNIESEMIEAQTFYDLAMQYKVSGVPKIVINETQELVGNQPIESFLEQLEK
ncbi:MAG: thioredoxin family protein [Bacilli bacterium]|nr:thioredoxin family protein [Bacilli bacterium]